MTSGFDCFFDYEKETGRLSWKVKKGRSRNPGDEAGTINSMGRMVVEVNGKKHLSHRVIWEMVFGKIHDGLVIDHIDGNILNNRIENLRAVTLSENQRNAKTPKNNRIGVMGVYRHSKGFVVQCAGKHIGYFTDFFEACCARKSAEASMGFHQNHGRISA